MITPTRTIKGTVILAIRPEWEHSDSSSNPMGQASYRRRLVSWEGQVRVWRDILTACPARELNKACVAPTPVGDSFCNPAHHNPATLGPDAGDSGTAPLVHFQGLRTPSFPGDDIGTVLRTEFKLCWKIVESLQCSLSTKLKSMLL